MRVAVLWSGGKESCLAFQAAKRQGHDITSLLTFMGDEPLLCHPLPIMSLQSKALGVPHITIRVEEPYLHQYRDSISQLIRRTGVEGLVTGDICTDIHKQWMEDVSDGLGVELIMPLWKIDSPRILDAVVSSGFKTIFTCVREPWFHEGWLGRELDGDCVKDLHVLHRGFGVDLCGENGEYHTSVLDGPIFKRPIHIDEHAKEKRGSLLFLKVNRCSLSHAKGKEH